MKVVTSAIYIDEKSQEDLRVPSKRVAMVSRKVF